jgi:hypothetical protein
MASAVEAQASKKDKVVTVIYNGRAASIRYTPQQAVQALLRHALKKFGVVAGADELALFTAAGAELPVDVSVKDAGVRPGDELVLRRRVVRGGS